jgi:hypothetical protein
MKHTFQMAFAFMLLLCLMGCRSEAENVSFESFDAAFERQSAALEILRGLEKSPEKAKTELEKLRSLHGDAIIHMRENKEDLRKGLSKKDQAYFEEVRNQLLEDLNQALSAYPASRVKELRYILMTL